MTEAKQAARVLFQPLTNGGWQSHPEMTDYRAEWLSSLLVERANWKEDSFPRSFGSAQIAGPGYVWFRFWLPEQDQVVEKYFDADGNAVGVYVPVTEALERRGEVWRTVELVLALWLDASGRVSVLREDDFDEAVEREILTPVAAEQAERRIRELTTAIAAEQFPPPLVRNFEINVEQV
jgi:predicted RNA-binding protein associated with RNAse of E/G family